ncbi:MAG: hypothetical protein ABH827_05525 [bacterium]
MKNIKKMLMALVLGFVFVGNAGATKPPRKGGCITDYFKVIKIGTKKESDKGSKLGVSLPRMDHENISKTEFGFKLAGFIGGLGLSIYTGLDLLAFGAKILMGTDCPVLSDEVTPRSNAIVLAVFEAIALGCFGTLSVLCLRDSKVSGFIKKYGCYAACMAIGITSLWLMKLV